MSTKGGDHRRDIRWIAGGACCWIELEDRLAFLDRLGDLDIGDGAGLNSCRILGQDGEIRQLAGLDAALRLFLEVVIGWPDCHSLQGRDDAHTLLRTNNATRAPGAARDRGIKHAHRIRECHRCIVVAGEDHAAHRPRQS